MRISLKTMQTGISPNVAEMLLSISRNTSRGLLSAASFTDSSTGTVGSALVPVMTQPTRVAQSGTNLASRSGFNTAMTAFNNAMAVMAAYFNTNALAKLDVPQLSGMTGTVATAGTIPAQTKTVTGIDGSTGDAMLRSEAGAAIARARNNLAHIVKAYNIVATAIGAATLNDLTGGHASRTMNINAGVTAGTAVAAGAVASSDLATKASIDAALLALANNIAFVANRTNNLLMAAAVLNARIPVTVTP